MNILDEEEHIQLVRDHSHASVLYRLWRDLNDERGDSIYTDNESKKIKEVVQLLSDKEEEIKHRYYPDDWFSLGDYTLFR